MIWGALRFPCLPLEALEIYRAEPRACVIEQHHRVLMATPAAYSQGVCDGMKMSTASAITDIHPCSREVDREQQALLRLASWAYKYTPYIQRYRDNCLLLEVSRSLRLYGGLEALVSRLAEGLDQMPYRWEIGVAHSAAGAWLLSFDPWPTSDQDSQAVFLDRISRVPLQRLVERQGLQPDTEEARSWVGLHKAFASLQKMGLGCLGEVFALPTASLGKRFGEEFQQFVQQLRGGAGSVPEVFQQHEAFCRQVPFNWPVRTTRLLELPAQELLQQLSDYLVRNQKQCQQIVWNLYGEDPSEANQQVSLVIQSAPVCQNWNVLFELTCIRLESLALDFEVMMLELRCDTSVPVQASSLQLFAGAVGEMPGQVQANVQSLVARMQTRFGREHIYHLQSRNEHLPEAAQVLSYENGSQAVVPNLELPRGRRPCWLLAQPRPLQRIGNRLYWRESRQNQSLRILDGPERIEGYWWSQPHTRDYFIARREDALHLWIYRELDNRQRWYAQGVFG